MQLFQGKHVVLTLVVYLLFLIYTNLSANNSSLKTIFNQQLPPLSSLFIDPSPTIMHQQPTPEIAMQVSPAQAVEGASTGKQIAQVVKVVDGDTIDVEIGGVRDKVRIIGIDTPETVDPRKQVQCFGKQASDFAKDTLTGKTVELESDPTQSDRDKYKRLLRFVFLSDGSIDYGKLVLQEGYGNEYTYDVPYKYQKEYKQAEKEARDSKKGLWADKACS